jgi:hypothetical protein
MAYDLFTITPIHTGRAGSPASNITHTPSLTFGCRLDPAGTQALAHDAALPVTAGTRTFRRRSRSGSLSSVTTAR